MRKNTLLVLLILILCATPVHPLSLSGDGLKNRVDFVPGKVYEFNYRFTNAQPYPAQYLIYPEKHKGGDMYSYFQVVPEKFENVEPQGTREFKVIIKFPEETSYPGESEYRVWVRESLDTGGAIRAVPAVGVRFIIFSLYPYKFLSSSLEANNINSGEKSTFKVNVANLGQPTIDEVSADISVYDMANSQIGSVSTDKALGLASRDSKQLMATFDSTGLKQGDYNVVAKVHWDGNESVHSSVFRVGELNVLLHGFTKEFKTDAINKMDIEVESFWNAQIPGINAEIVVTEPTGLEMKRFKSFSADLMPWERRVLESYFDTTGIPAGEYDAKVILSYAGKTAVKTEKITIKEETSAVVVPEIPKEKSFSLKGIFSGTVLIVGILIISAIVNILLLLKKEKKKSESSSVSQDVVDNIRNLLKDHTEKDLRELLLKKGWPKESVEEIFRRIK